MSLICPGRSAKGGYLEGSIALPESRDREEQRRLRLVLSTHPDEDPVLAGDLRAGTRQAESHNFHPSIIHVVR